MKPKIILFIVLLISLVSLSYISYSLTFSDRISAQSVYADYEFTPAFISEVDLQLNWISNIEGDAKSMVFVCGDLEKDNDFVDCIKNQVAHLNQLYELGPIQYYWRYGSQCDNHQFIPSDRKIVFCVNLSKQYDLKDGKYNISYKFALDFSGDAKQVSIGNPVKKCTDGTSFGFCRRSQFCAYDPMTDSYEMRQDCRGLDMNLGTPDDCPCPPGQACQADGTCEPTGVTCTDGIDIIPVSACMPLPPTDFCTADGE